MSTKHTVEKIGGTSMSEFGDIVENILIGNKTEEEIYNRIFVVSAYGGVTNLLLEHKKTGEPGVYQYFAEGNESWKEALDALKGELCKINRKFEHLGLNLEAADNNVIERLEGIRNCLQDVQRLCSYGHFELKDYLPAVRELLSSVGEAHSAFNSVDILKSMGYNAVLADLTGWKNTKTLNFTDKVKTTFDVIDISNSLVIATGYTKCTEGLMETYDRGYSEITFSKIACVTGAREGIIHKEFHLSTGDPNVIGVDKVKIIGSTNFDVADQLADLGMEAIHPRASKDMEIEGIAIRIKNAFEPEHPGTLISTDFISKSPRVEIITGRSDLLAIEVWDPDMVGQSGYDYNLTKCLADHGVSYVAKNTNANTITHYVVHTSKNLEACIEKIQTVFPQAKVKCERVAIVSAIGSNMSFPGFLAKASKSLADADINILAIDQCMRQVNMQFVVSVDDFNPAIKALHKGVVEVDLS